MPKLVIDDREIEVPRGTKVIEAAEQLGIIIPRFCYFEAMGSVGACRMCAVKFLQGPFKGVQMSCMIDAQDGMVVSTTDKEAVEFRRYVIEWLMLNHPHDCPVCDEGGQCLLQDETVSSGHGIRRYLGKKRTYKDQDLGVFIAHEMNRCIHCYRCSRFYQDFAGYRDLGPMQIGDRVFFGRFTSGQLESPFSGNLVDICPTGVYTDIPARYRVRRWDLQRSHSVCPHCSLGCNTIANARYRAIMRVEARLNKQVNGAFICDRGRFGFGFANHADRPRRGRIDGREVVWEEAIGAAGERLARIGRESGGKAIACLGSERASVESQEMLKRFCSVQQWPQPGFFVSPSLERKAKTAVARLDERTGVSLREIERADFVLVVGADPINEAPMLAFWMRQAFRNEAAVVVIDPRPMFLPMEYEHLPVATQDLERVLAALVRLGVSREDLEKQGPELVRFYEELPGAEGLEAPVRERLEKLAPLLQKSKNPVLICGTDIVPETTPGAAADLALLLHAAKGSRGLFYVLPGANSFGAALVSPEDGHSFLHTIEAIEQGTVKALLVVENDPFTHFPDRQRLEQALSKLDLLVVLDYTPSETVRRADIVIPVSTWFESGATFINQEGRAQFAESVHRGGLPIAQVSGGSHPPRTYDSLIPGQDAGPAWEVLTKLARAMELSESQLSALLSWDRIVDESPALAALRDAHYPVHGVRVVREENREADFTSRFDGRKPSARPDGRLELLLEDWTFGTEELSEYAEPIQRVEAEPALSLHTGDAARAGLSDGDRVGLELGRGPVEVKVKLTDKMAPGTMVLPRHRQLSWQKIPELPVFVPLSALKKL